MHSDLVPFAAKVDCPNKEFVTSFNAKIQTLPDSDNFGMSGVRMICQGGEVIASGEAAGGTYQPADSAICPGGFDGVQIRIQNLLVRDRKERPEGGMRRVEDSCKSAVLGLYFTHGSFRLHSVK